MTVRVDVSNSPYGLCERKATLNWNCSISELMSCVRVEVGRPGLPVPNSPYGFRGCKATLNWNCSVSELRSCVKVEVDVLGSPSLTVLVVSVDVEQH